MTIDNTASYISRFQTLNLNLTANPGGAASLHPHADADQDDSALQFDALTYGSGAGLGVGPGAPAENTAGKFYFTGRSDNFGPGGSRGDHERALRPRVGSRVQ